MSMKRLLSILSLLLFAVSCGSQTKKLEGAPQVVQPVQYTFTIKNVYPHSTQSYTQGLQYVDGVLWEGTGEWGESRLQKCELESGKVEVLKSLPRSEFGEGITLLGERIYQLTWQNGVMHIYDRRSLREIATHRYRGEGWGLTSDGQMLYMSDGTPDIRVIDPQTLASVRTIAVTLEGESLPYLNELEWIEGRIWANVYTTDYILIINPETGIVPTFFMGENCAYGYETFWINCLLYTANGMMKMAEFTEKNGLQ